MGALRTKQFWGDALERAVSTAAQVVLSVTGADELNLINLNLNAVELITLAALGFGLSIIKAIGASYTGDKQSASLIEQGLYVYTNRNYCIHHSTNCYNLVRYSTDTQMY